MRLAWIDGVRNVAPGLRELPTNVFERARQEVYRASRWKAIGLAALAGVVAGLGVLPGLMVAKRTGGGALGMLGWAIGSGAVIALPVVFGVILPASRRMYARRLIECVLACGHCPGCRHDLRAVHSGTGAHTICPECGAGWEAPKAGFAGGRAPGRGRAEERER